MPFLQTPILEIDYEERGYPLSLPVLLFHGFPDTLHARCQMVASIVKDQDLSRYIL